MSPPHAVSSLLKSHPSPTPQGAKPGTDEPVMVFYGQNARPKLVWTPCILRENSNFIRFKVNFHGHILGFGAKIKIGEKVRIFEQCATRLC